MGTDRKKSRVHIRYRPADVLEIADVENSHTVARAISAFRSLLLDIPIPHDSRRHLKDVNAYMKKVVLTTPFITFVRTLSNLYDDLVKGLTSVNGCSSKGSFIQGIADIQPLARLYIKWYTGDIQESDEPRVLQFLSSVLVFLKKTEYSQPELKDSALADWLENDKRLRKISPSTELTSRIRMIIDGLTPKRISQPLLPKHGNGAVTEGVKGVNAKNQFGSMAYPRKILAYYYGGTRYVVKEATRTVTAVKEDLLKRVSPTEDVPEILQRYAYRPATLLFVWKDVKSLRSICKEPAAMQYHQQSELLKLDVLFRTSTWSKMIDMGDQIRSQKAAQQASALGTHSTIDLSKASDSIAYSVIKAVMPHRLLKPLTATRSTRVKLPNGRIYRMAKFAPMGSAVCFPVQSMLFAATSLLAYLTVWYWKNVENVNNERWFATMPSDYMIPIDAPVLSVPELLQGFTERLDNKLVGKRSRSILIFGDDIILPEEAVDTLYTYLSDLGLIVNTDKSFRAPSEFREACGMFAWRGVDVTPLKAKTPLAPLGSLDHLKYMIGLANRAYALGYKHLRSSVIQSLLFDEWDTLKDADIKIDGVNAISFTNDPDDTSKVYTERSGKDLNRHLPLRIKYYGPLKELDREIRYGRIIASVLPWANTPGSGLCEHFTRGISVVPCDIDDITSDAYNYVQYWRNVSSTATDESRKASLSERLVHMRDSRHSIRTTIVDNGIRKPVWSGSIRPVDSRRTKLKWSWSLHLYGAVV